MEDRHSFSDPRPVPGTDNLPTWEVDVLRDGKPVCTLIINNKTLPPRVRKKKVVWKLPDSTEGNPPNFGSDEKRRLLKLFKQEKKNRRKTLKQESSSKLLEVPKEREPPKDAIPLKKEEQTLSQPIKEVDMNEVEPPRASISAPPGMETVAPTESRQENGGQMTQQQQPLDVHTNGHDPVPLAQQAPPSQEMAPALAVLVSAPPGMEAVAPTEAQQENGGHMLQQQQQQQQTVDLHTNGHDSIPLAQQVPPSQEMPPSPLPPPGFDQASLPQSDPNARYFNVSTNDPVHVAHCLVNIYYPCITHGHADELLLHYVSKAQKSLSVGGAHAFCFSGKEILLQLQSLLGSTFNVVGVVAQQGVGDSVVVLITGTVTSAAGTFPFCHSLTLVRIGDSNYQIHNDAMALLTADNNNS